MANHPNPLRALFIISGSDRRLAALQTASHPTFGDISSWLAWQRGCAHVLLTTSLTNVARLLRDDDTPRGPFVIPACLASRWHLAPPPPVVIPVR